MKHVVRSPLVRSHPSNGLHWRAVGKRVHVALLSRDGETMGQLLERLDTALGKVMADNSVIDEVLPEIKRRRSR